MEEVVQAVAGTEGLSETEILLNETEKFKNIHEQKVAEETKKELSQNAETFGEWILLQNEETIRTHTPQQLQTMFEYDTSVDPEILDYVEFAKENPEKRWAKIDIGEVSDRAVNDIKRETGVDITGYSHYMDIDFITHVEKRHGENGKSNQSMRNDEDIARIGYVLENYDSVKNTGEKSKKYKNKDGSYADKIIYEKAINGTYYIVEAVPEASKKRLNLVTAYISTKKETPNVRKADAKSPGLTSETAPRADGISNSIISPVDGKSNPPSIGNNVFGAGIFGNQDSQTAPQGKSDEEFYAEILGLEDTVPSFVRADINRIVNDPSITNEQKFYDLMALYDSAKTPAEKSEIGRYIYQMKTMPTERKPFFGIKNRASSSAKSDAEQNATFVQERGIETPEGMNLLQEEVETNIGRMPVEDYREILAAQNGFNSYEEMQAEARAMEEWDRKEEEWRKEQAEAQMKEIIREERSRRFVREETKAEPGASEFVSAEISDSAKRVLEQMAPKTEKQSSTSQVNPETESTNLADVPQSKKSERIERRYQKAVEDGVASVFGIDRRDI